jgi:hypothetical protein
MIAEGPEPVEFSRIRAAYLAATFRAVASTVEMYPGITGEEDPYYAALEVIAKGVGCVLDSDSGVTVLEAARLREALEVEDAPPRRMAIGETISMRPSLADRAREMADELREDADTVEEFPGIMNFGPGTREFSRALYEAQEMRDGIILDEMDTDLTYLLEDEDEGDEDEGDEAALPAPCQARHPPRVPGFWLPDSDRRPVPGAQRPQGRAFLLSVQGLDDFPARRHR